VRLKVFITLLSISLGLSLVPVVNYSIGLVEHKQGSVIERYFNLDYFNYLLARELRPFGISLRPTQVIVGKNDWFFLGNQYSQSLEIYRYDREYHSTSRVDLLNQAFEDLKELQKGIDSLYVFVAPEKGSIYPENFPDWVADGRQFGRVLTAVEFPPFITDLYSDIAAKKLPDGPLLYERHDSHWSQYGAWLGYQAIAQKIGVEWPDLKWLSEADVEIKKIEQRKGPDLLRLIGLEHMKIEDDFQIFIGGKAEISFVYSDLLKETPSQPSRAGKKSFSSKSYFLNQFDGAKNSKRILWIRDSFGDQLFRFMGYTFAEILEVHRDTAFSNVARLEDIIEQYKPELVILTESERRYQCRDSCPNFKN
jgi:hypothetical protein